MSGCLSQVTGHIAQLAASCQQPAEQLLWKDSRPSQSKGRTKLVRRMTGQRGREVCLSRLSQGAGAA